MLDPTPEQAAMLERFAAEQGKEQVYLLQQERHQQVALEGLRTIVNNHNLSLHHAPPNPTTPAVLECLTLSGGVAFPPPQHCASAGHTTTTVIPGWVHDAVSSLPEPVPGFRQVEVTLVALMPTFCPGHLARSLTAAGTSDQAAELALSLLQHGFSEMVG
jgi:hypothetical protein